MGFNSVVVDVSIGLALIFFLVATIAAGVNQVISRWTDARAKVLWQSLTKLLEPAGAAAGPTALPAGADIGALTAIKMGVNTVDPRPTGSPAAGAALSVEELLATPSIRALDPVGEAGKPTKVDNIPPQVFATALLELARIKGSNDSDSVEEKLTTLASAYQDTPLGTFSATLASAIGDDLDSYMDAAGNWFDGQMSRLSQVYRKNTRWMLFIIGAFAALVFNVDAIQIGNTLRDDSDLRAGVLTLSAQLGDDGGLTTDCTVPEGEADRELRCARELVDSLNGLGVPVIGHWTWDTWKQGWEDADTAFWHIVGLLLTAGAVSLGAPFWFDALKRLSGFRRSG